MKRRLLAMLLVMALLPQAAVFIRADSTDETSNELPVIPIGESSEDPTEASENEPDAHPIEWSFAQEAGTLTLTGSGSMENYASAEDVPWAAVRAEIKQILLPDGLTNIGDFAFQGCTALTAVTLPGSVSQLGKSAFQGCKALTAVTLPDGLETIGKEAFRGCSALVNLEIPETVTEIGADALTDTAIYNNADNWDGGLFYRDGWLLRAKNDLTAALVTADTLHIADGAFSGCSSLAGATLPTGLKSIGAEAFSGCTELAGLTLPTGLERIGANMMENTAFSKKTENWKDGLLCLGGWVLSADADLAKAELASGTVGVADAAFSASKESLTDVTLPKGLQHIGKEAFQGCALLDVLSLPDGLRSIGNNAFSGCAGLSELVFPASVQRFGSRAFSGCELLESATVLGTGQKFSAGVFSECPALTVSGYKGASIAVYAKDEGYPFTEIQQADQCKSGHNWDEWSETKAATCTAAGAKARVCLHCGKEETASIDALGHSVADNKWSITTAATCTGTGVESGPCTRCGQTVTRTLSALGHSYGSPSYVWSSDNSSVTATRICSRDSFHKETKTAKATSTTTTATCTAAGKTTYTAAFTDSGYSTQTKTVDTPALGHSWGSWYQTTAATCTAKGVETRTCSRCKQTEKRDVAALGHNYVSGYCTRCGKPQSSDLPYTGL